MELNGVFFIWPDGCDWFAVEFARGRVVSQTAACQQATHNAARDAWAGLDPANEVEVDTETANAVLDALGLDPDAHVVTRYP